MEKNGPLSFPRSFQPDPFRFPLSLHFFPPLLSTFELTNPESPFGFFQSSARVWTTLRPALRPFSVARENKKIQVRSKVGEGKDLERRTKCLTDRMTDRRSSWWRC